MLIIENARIVTMAGTPIERGYCVIEGDRIKRVGKGNAPTAMGRQGVRGEQTASARGERDAGAVSSERTANVTAPVRYDAAGGWLMPGLMDPHCHLGIFDDGLRDEGDDGNETTDPVTPHLRAIDGIFQDDRCFSEALEAGITAAMTGPGSANVIGGQFALLHTVGRTTDEMALAAYAAMKAAFGENPKRVYGRKDRSPYTRMATAATLRDALEKARFYREERLAAEMKSGKKADKGGKAGKSEPIGYEKKAPDAKWEALLPVLTGAKILKIHCHRSDDILSAVRIAEEAGLRYTLDHCTEGYLIADLLADIYRRGQAEGHGCGEPGKGRLVGVICGPLLSDRSKPELNRSNIRNPGLLAAAGLPVGIMTDHPVVPIQYLPVSAAMAVRAGMDETAALAAITSTAALLCDAAAERGTVEAGKKADLVVFDGHPFEYRTRARLVLIDGQKVWTDAAAR